MTSIVGAKAFLKYPKRRGFAGAVHVFGKRSQHHEAAQLLNVFIAAMKKIKAYRCHFGVRLF